LDTDCQSTIFAAMKMQSEDIRLNPTLSSSCEGALSRFCKDTPQSAKVGCLLDYMHDTDMDAGCYQRLEDETEKRTKSIAFNPGLMRECKADLERIQAAHACKTGVQMDGSSIECLIQFRGEVTSPTCKAQVLSTLRRQSNDVRAKPGMSTACASDIKLLCAGIVPGGGRLHMCLREHLSELQPMCKERVGEVYKAESEDVTLNPGIRENCRNERNAYCRHVRHGKSRVLVCLNVHKAKEGFSAECRIALSRVHIQEEIVRAQREAEDARVSAAVTLALAEIKTWLWKRGGLDEEGGFTFWVGSAIGSLTTAGLVFALFILMCRRCKATYHGVPDRMD